MTNTAPHTAPNATPNPTPGTIENSAPAEGTTAPAPEESAAAGAQTRAVIEEYLRRVADPAAGPEEIAAVYAEQVDWQIAPNPAVPWIRPRATRADVVGHWVELAAHTVADEGGAQIDALVIEGAEAVLTGHLHGTVRATGKQFRSPFALRLTVQDGEIVRHHIYEDSLAIAAACTPDGPAAGA